MKDAVRAVSGGFSVGPWEVEPALHLLRHAGETVRLEPKVMEVLVHLASRAPAVVPREELIEAVWGTPYVSEDLPRRAVYELRKAFRDDPKEPRFIETIPRSGYRLVARVTPLSTDSAGLSEPAAAGPDRSLREMAAVVEPPAPRHVGSWRRTASALALGVALLGAALLAAFLRGDPEPASAGLRPVPLTALPGLEYDPAFSPDGTRIAFLRTPDPVDGTGMALHVQLVGTESSLRLTDGPADFGRPIQSPTWSPDGTELAYLRWRSGEGWGIYRVPALGGSERKLLVLGRTNVLGLAWSPDGRWLALGLASADDGPLALHRIDLETLERERLTAPPATVGGDRLPAWSPDGGSLAFVRNFQGEAAEVRVMPASGGPSRSLLPGHHKIADLDWSPDGRRILVAVHDGGRHRVWSVDVATGGVRRRGELGEDTRWISVARRGGRFAYGRARWRFAIRRYDLATGESAPLPGLSSTFYDGDLDVSPAGDRIALVSTRSGSFEVWTSDLDGGHPLQLTDFQGALVGHLSWLPGGRSLVFHAQAEGRSGLWTVPADGGGPRRLAGVAGEAGDDVLPTVSADGRSIYFASDRGGEWQVWRVGVEGGAPEPVVGGGAYLARESPDGEWLYFTRWHRDGLWRVPVGGGPEERVVGEELPATEWGNWMLAPGGIYFVSWPEGEGPTLAFLSLESRRVERRFPLSGTPVQPSLALAPGGTFAFLAELDHVESDIVLVNGFDGSDG